tara:strand:+ start:308 stop:523 length:216 start_codon:yes stop_codon:yes gene_type:complete
MSLSNFNKVNASLEKQVKKALPFAEANLKAAWSDYREVDNQKLASLISNALAMDFTPCMTAIKIVRSNHDA